MESREAGYPCVEGGDLAHGHWPQAWVNLPPLETLLAVLRACRSPGVANRASSVHCVFLRDHATADAFPKNLENGGRAAVLIKFSSSETCVWETRILRMRPLCCKKVTVSHTRTQQVYVLQNSLVSSVFHFEDSRTFFRPQSMKVQRFTNDINTSSNMRETLRFFK
jgi:hypothetical protein